MCFWLQGALLNMFGEQLNPSELISVQEVQAHTQPDHTRFTSPPSSPQPIPGEGRCILALCPLAASATITASGVQLGA
eukprot:scaffold167841_cov20-Tisochrysis_lutea.AAC.1